MATRFYQSPYSRNRQISIATLISCGLFLAISFTDTMGQSTFDRGKKFYQQRDANADSFKADPTNINRAIDLFKSALEQGINPEESAAYLLRSYYFKAMFTGLSEDQQKDIYEKGRNLGEKMIERYPNSVPIKFWYAANIGRWADVHSFARAATSGISKQLRGICKDIIEKDPGYQDGGGYRILAQVHFYSPNIPILMSWPSKDKALELVQEALEIAPENPTNKMLYANILLEFDRDEEAKKLLHQIRRMTPRSSHKVEDRYLQYRSQKLYDEHFN
ncbi:tetratricopeptide repeat protein [Fodinibius sp.]|uniref:tetratricopeptide repeat protein n=1 Tax=Fodinibius sp. TaxID=1872440 RepID=UPI002ACE4C67|nr:tetratricopeptide repeat protein [Fodinibius sp.]MDZ7658341.1 tetratricopeptide repeat protein [Fodinibius sp.]